MIFLIALVLTLIIVGLFSKPLRKHPIPFYFASVLISVLVVRGTWSHAAFPEWFGNWVWPVFARGALAGALFIVVMWTGALPNGSKLIKRLMPIRAQFSIIACILTLGHNIAYGKTYFTALFVNPSRLSMPTLLAAVCSLVMILIMLPLFATSFKAVRKKMKASRWKQLQRSAYLFYGLLYCHILLLAVPNAISGRAGYKLTVFVYSFVFLSYLLCRIMKAVAIKEKTAFSLQKKQAGGIICGAFMSTLILLAVISAGNSFAAREELASLQKVMEIQNSNVAVPERSAATETIPEQTAEFTASARAAESTEVPQAAGKYKDGVYTGSAEGNHGSKKDIEVAVTVDKDNILSIEIIGFRDDEEYFSPSIEGAVMIEEILTKQSPYVDAISGATETSVALIHAVSAALTQARNQ